MQSRHTPAPWQIGKRYGNNRTEIVDESYFKALATVWTHFQAVQLGRRPCGVSDYKPSPEGVANARLIAAAPELLDVLTTILDVWEDQKIIGPMTYHDARALVERVFDEDH